MAGVGSGRQEVAHAHVERLGDFFQRAERGRLLQVEQAAQVRAADAGVVGEAVLLPATATQVVANDSRQLAVELRRHTPTVLTPRAKRFPIRQLLFKAITLSL